MSKPDRVFVPFTRLRNSLSVIFGRAEAAVFIGGVVTAVLQTVIVREVLAVMSGNELVIGLILALWLAATALGSMCGKRFPVRTRNAVIFGMLLSFVFGLTGIRAVRLLFRTGTALSPPVLFPLLLLCEGPGAFLGGYLFGWLSIKSSDRPIYRWEQIGTLLGMLLLSGMVAFGVPNWVVAALSLGMLIVLLPHPALRVAALIPCVGLLFTDALAINWKYPLPVERVVYTPEAEVATAMVDDEKIVFVNGELYRVDFSVPQVEQAVHVPVGMVGGAKSVLLINSAGHYAEAEKYPSLTVSCIRTDHLIADSVCPYGSLESLHGNRYDIIILGCGIPDNGASSRYFTRSFFKDVHAVLSDSGVFSFTLPFNTDFVDPKEEQLRSILYNTLGSVFRHVTIFPGEGFTFVASDGQHSFSDTCTVSTDYYATMILPSVTDERMVFVNRPPTVTAMHTAARPRLLMVALDRYLSMFPRSYTVVTAVLLLFIVLFVSAVRVSNEAVSVGTTGMSVGIFSMALLLLFQSHYGTVYTKVSLLLLSLASGFAAGSFIRRFPFSDYVIGVVTGGILLAMAGLNNPPELLFYAGDAVAGFFAAAQFVTRKNTRIEMLYASDCAGGVFGAALSATMLIPLVGVAWVAVGIVCIKLVVGSVFGFSEKNNSN